MDDRPEEVDDRPWEQPGNPRRDCLPHRAVLLRQLGDVAFGCCLLSAVLIVPALISVPLGIAVWIMAGQDLAKMRAGTMDPQGQTDTERARKMAIGCVLFSFVYTMALGTPVGKELLQIAFSLP